MNVKVIDIKKILLFLIVFLTFLGFYATVILASNVLGRGGSTLVSIPIRLLIDLLCIFTILIDKRFFKGSIELRYYFIFALFFVFRILVDFLLAKYYYMPFSMVLMYFISFSFIPFLCLITVRLNKELINSIFKGIVSSSVFFVLVSILFYGEFVGKVSRLYSSDSSEIEGVVNPLILSYCSVVILGVIGFYWLFNKVSFFKKIIFIGLISLSTIPFFLGSSRGSLIALILPFFGVILTSNILSKLKFIFLSVIILFGVIYLDQYFGSGLLNRLGVFNEEADIVESSGRIFIWEKSLNQFFNNPIFGDKLQVDDWSNYPHNIFIEVLQTTGILGFIPFFLLVFSTIKKTFWIFKNSKQYMWLGVLFLQSLTQSLFSGNLFMAAWFWTSMALVISTYYYLRNDSK